MQVVDGKTQFVVFHSLKACAVYLPDAQKKVLYVTQHECEEL